MALGSLSFPSFFLLLLISFNLLLHSARSDDASDKLFQGINSYRASLNLPALTDNKNAACLADKLAEQFKDQPCTNTTGSNTVLGTEQQFPNYPDFLDHCHLNTTVTRDGSVMPACVPDLETSLVLTNFTKSQYSESLNNTQFTGAGIASGGNWIVVVLTTNTPEGNFATVTALGTALGCSVCSILASILLGFFMIMMR